jgi:hypothetical protein
VRIRGFDSRKIVSWCLDKYEHNRRVIQLQWESLVSFLLSVFRRILKLPEPTKTFKGEEARKFLEEINFGLEILSEYLEDPTTMTEDLENIKVNLLENPYKEIAWLFTRVTGQESIITIPHLALHILYFTIHEKEIFDWAKIISIEISSQLTNLKGNKRFYMSSHLIFSITYCHVFKGLSIGRRVDCKIDPVPMWYQDLWRQRVTYNFYEVYNGFVQNAMFERNSQKLILEKYIQRIKEYLDKNFISKAYPLPEFIEFTKLRVML